MKKTLIAISVLFSLSSYAEDKIKNKFHLEFDTSVPEEFLYLEEQMFYGYIDFKFDSFYLRNIKISYNEKTIKVENIDDLIRKLLKYKKIKNKFIPMLRMSLEERKSTNTNYLCINNVSCKKDLEPEIIEFIFNPKDLVGYILINTEMIDQKPNENNIISEPNKSFSINNNMSYNFNDVISSSNNSHKDAMVNRVNIDSTVSYGSKRFNFKSGYNYDKPFFSFINYQNESKGQLFTVGYMNPIRLNSTYNSEDIVGIGLGTSKKTRRDFQSGYIKPLILNLSRRSFVKVYAKGRLLYQGSLNSGLQELTIPQLSLSSSKLDIVLIDEFGVETKYKKNYVKNNRIVDTYDWIWNFNIGKKLNKTQSYNEYFSPLSNIGEETYALYSLEKKINNYNMLGFEFILDDDRNMFSFSSLYEFDKIDNHTSFMISNDYSEFVNTFNYTNKFNRFNSTYRRINDEDNEQYELDFNYYHNFSSDLSGSINYSLYGDNQSETQKNFRMSVLKNYRINEKRNLLFDTYISKNSKEFSIGLRMEISSAGFINNRYELDLNSGENGTNRSASFSRSGNYENFNTNHSLNFQGNNNYKSYGLTNTINSNKYGNGSITYQKQKNNESKETIYGNFNTSLIATSKSIVWTGASFNKSGAIISFDKKDYGKEFELYSGRSRQKIIADEKVFVPLGEYDMYELKLQNGDQQDLFKKVNNKIESFSLYSNNFIDLKWDIYRYKILYGQLIKENGDPIAFSLIETKNDSSFTDEQGFFSLNIEKLNEIRVNNYTCDFSNILLDEDIIVNTGIICKDSSEDIDD
jgi:hypothetical protein